MPPGVYHGSINLVWGSGSLAVPVVFTIAASFGSPPAVAAIVNSASQLPLAISPGELITIFGTGISSTTNGLTLSANGQVATSLGGAQVTINGLAAPLIYASPTQLNLIVPYEVAKLGCRQFSYPGGWHAVLRPGEFPLLLQRLQSSRLPHPEKDQGAIVNQDGSINSASNLGCARHHYPDLCDRRRPDFPRPPLPEPSRSRKPTLPPRNYDDRRRKTPRCALCAGNAPDEVEGVVQIKRNRSTECYSRRHTSLPVLITTGGVPSTAAITVAVQ